MEFGSVDAAAFVFAILAILISIEQFARLNEDILDKDFKTTIAHICSISLPGDIATIHYKKLNKSYNRLLIEKGFTPWEFSMNGNHPAQSRLWKKIWSVLLISIVAKLLRKRIVFLAFITAIVGYILTIPLRLWLIFLFNYTHSIPWKNRTTLRWTGNNKHISGYNGQQFDKFITSWLSQLNWSPDEEMEEIITWVAYLASWTGDSKIVGPTCAVRLAIEENINIGDIIADASLYMKSIHVYYID